VDDGGGAGLTDEELAAQAAREGSDGVAFSALVDRFRDRVWRVCWRLMGDEHDAQDAAQEVFVRLFFDRAKFAGRSLALRRSRSRRRRRETAESAAGDDARTVQSHADPRPAAAHAVEAAHDAARLLDALDEEDRALVLMKFAEGHDYDELAEMFGTTAGALRMRVSRIRERLAGGADRPAGGRT
jgi:RNA polymerase sigma-70 factor (ECF subfamily)